MAQKLIFTDGLKSVNMLDSDDPAIWNYFSGKPDAQGQELYARVAAAFTAVNKVARAVANVPFVIMKGEEEWDTSRAWENKIGVMPNPKDLLRRLRQSIVFTNSGYLRLGKNRLGLPKQLHYVMPSSININTDLVTGALVSLDRTINGRIEKSYAPDDPELLRFWWLDDKTELLPSPDTEFKSIMNAAGVLYWSDAFTKLYFQRGGVKPTLIAMKGLISKDKEADMVAGWTSFVRGIGNGMRNITAKIFNAEAMDIKPFGEGLGDLKETPVFRQALENIAMGLNMPLSMLLSNSNNYATAQVEQRTFYHDNVVPWFDFIADELNTQLLLPMGLRMENRAESDDPMQEEEAMRQTAASGFGDIFAKYPTYDLLVTSLSDVFGYELSDRWLEAAEKYYTEKKQADEEMQAQLTQRPNEQPTDIKPGEKPEEDDTEDIPEKKPFGKAWTLEELNELRVWQEVALRFYKRAEPIPEYIPHHGGLPKDITASIKKALSKADSVQAIKAAFVFGVPPVPPADDNILLLAQAMNNLANAQKTIEAPNMTFNLTANMPEPGSPTVNIKAQMPEQPAPVINVQASPVTVENVVNIPETQVTVNNDVRPSPVILPAPKNARVIRGRDGKIEGLEAE